MKLNISENHYSKKEIKMDNKIEDKEEELEKNIQNLFILKNIYKIIIFIVFVIIIIICIINLLTKDAHERFHGTTPRPTKPNSFGFSHERFYGIIPCFIKPNSFGFFESNKNGLENIPKSNIIYKREEFSYIQKIEQSQMGNINENIEASIQADIIIYHSKFNFDFQVNEIINKYRTFSYYIVKYYCASINIKTEDIKLDKLFVDKINKIAFSDDLIEVRKAYEIDKLFENYGFYIPQKIYLGASYIRKIDNTMSSEIKFLDIKGKLDIKSIIKAGANYEKDSIMNFLNSKEKTDIIGGNKYANNFEEWKSSVNEDNMDIIGYDNFLEIAQLLDFDLKKKIQIPINLIEKKYKLRKQYIQTIKNLKESLSLANLEGDTSTSQGICDVNYNELIYSWIFPFREDWILFGNSETNFYQSFNDIIVG